MPRLDRTFTGRDVTRVYEKHLDRFEREFVLQFFLRQTPSTPFIIDLLDAVATLIAPFDQLITVVADIVFANPLQQQELLRRAEAAALEMSRVRFLARQTEEFFEDF